MSNFRTWQVIAEDGDGKIHVFCKTIDESESWTLDALRNEVEGHGVTILAMYRVADIIEVATL